VRAVQQRRRASAIARRPRHGSTPSAKINVVYALRERAVARVFGSAYSEARGIAIAVAPPIDGKIAHPDPWAHLLCKLCNAGEGTSNRRVRRSER